MEISHIIGPVDAVEAEVRDVVKVGWREGLRITLPESFPHRNSILMTNPEVDMEKLIGTRVVVHYGAVYVSDNGNSGERLRVIRAYTPDGIMISDHAPGQNGYITNSVIRFDG